MEVISADEISPVERFAFWREMSAKFHGPYDLRCDPQTEREFAARAAVSECGPVQAMLTSTPPHALHRTPRLIRQADPEVFELCCNLRGGRTVVQDGRSAYLGNGDLMLFDPSRPFNCTRSA